jgi:tetratricopeptide (TPR) repeat protein
MRPQSFVRLIAQLFAAAVYLLSATLSIGVLPRQALGFISLWDLHAQSPSQAQQANGRNVTTPPHSLTTALNTALAQGQIERAREILGEFLQTPHLDSNVLLQVGIKLAQQELYPESAQVFARCIKDYPELFEGYYNLALAEYALAKFPEALEVIAKVPHSSRRQDVARLYLRGKIEDAMGEARQAERDLSAAFAGAPGEENYALDLGLFYMRRQNYQRAAEVFQQGTAIQGHSPFQLLGLSLAQFLGGRPAESVETCRRILSRQPDFSPARLLMAFALYMDGKFDEAEKVAAAGLAAPHPFPYLYYLHAVVLLKLQSRDYDRMLSDLALATRAIPDCSLCYLIQSKVHRAIGRPEAATDDLEKAIALDPTFAEAWYRLASLYDQAGRRADALRARTRFRGLKEEKTNRETEMIRNVFLQTLAGGSTPVGVH